MEKDKPALSSFPEPDEVINLSKSYEEDLVCRDGRGTPMEFLNQAHRPLNEINPVSRIYRIHHLLVG